MIPNSKSRPRVFGQTEVKTESVPVSPLDTLSLQQPFNDELPLLGETKEDSNIKAEVYTSVSVRIPQSLYDLYSKTADAQGMSVEDVLQHRLLKCKNHNSIRGIWFSDSERTQLEKLLKKWPLETATQILTLLSQAGNIDIEDLKVCLTLPQRKVLSIRTRYGSSPKQVFEAMIRKEFQV